MPTKYEPSDEVRIFDGGADDEDVEGSRLPLLIVIALLVLAAFGAVVWLAYQRGVQQGHAEVPRVIAAESGPAKVPPSTQGGTSSPFIGLKIYQQPAPSNADAESDVSSPPAAGPAATIKPSQVDSGDGTPNKPIVVATSVSPPPSSALTPKPAPVAAVKPTQVGHGDGTLNMPITLPTSVNAAASATAPSGGFVQVGAYKSLADANAAWLAFKTKHSSLLSGATSDIRQADLGAKGTWYRLRIVAADRNSAAALCGKLEAEGASCITAK